MIIFGALMYLVLRRTEIWLHDANALAYWAIVTNGPSASTVTLRRIRRRNFRIVAPRWFDWLFGDCDSYRTD